MIASSSILFWATGGLNADHAVSAPASNVTNAIAGTARRATKIKDNQLPVSSRRCPSSRIAARIRVSRNGDDPAASVSSSEAAAARRTRRPASSNLSVLWLFVLNISKLQAACFAASMNQDDVSPAKVTGILTHFTAVLPINTAA